MRKTENCNACVQTMPSGPLLASTNTTERVVESTHVKSVPAPSVTTHHQHAAPGDKTTTDTPKPSGSDVAKQAVEDAARSKPATCLFADTPKPSGSDVAKQTVEDAARSKPAASLFADDDNDAAEDLFAPSAASKVLALFLMCHLYKLYC